MIANHNRNHHINQRLGLIFLLAQFSGPAQGYGGIPVEVFDHGFIGYTEDSREELD